MLNCDGTRKKKTGAGGHTESRLDDMGRMTHYCEAHIRSEDVNGLLFGLQTAAYRENGVSDRVGLQYKSQETGTSMSEPTKL